MGNDLKIILYIVVAIVWVVYNNYRKIAGESRKRNPSRPPDEVIRENWPTVSGESQDKRIAPAPPVTRKPVTPKVAPLTIPAMARTAKALSQRQTEESLASASMVNPAAEGGRNKPSGLVHFEEPLMAPVEHSTLVEHLRHTDLQTVFLWSEIFKNPYNQSLETMKYH